MKRFVCLLLIGFSGWAQSDITGKWSPRYHEDSQDRIEGPDLGDYTGIPLNDAARFRADAWDASQLSLPERQCMPHPADYTTHGPSDMRILEEVDLASQAVVAYHMHIRTDGIERTIWMDGRPHPPPYAAHTWQGFSTGQWEHGMLTVTTTHLKPGFLRRNGVPRSEHATLTEHWMRHGNHLTLFQIIDDPAYLSEPLVRSRNWVANPDLPFNPFVCESVIEVDRPAGAVPHHLPGTNPFLEEFAHHYSLPLRASRGGAETLYPGISPFAPHAQPTANIIPDQEIHVLPVRGNVFMLTGAGGNITIQTGRNGVVLVDTGSAGKSDEVLAAIRKLTNQPIRTIVMTSADKDQAGGNEQIAKAGRSVLGFGPNNIAFGMGERGATVVAHENVLKRMSSQGPGRAPEGSWPNDTFIRDRKNLFVNGEAVEIEHLAGAHTDGDSVVFFRRSDVVSAGDVFDITRYPNIDIEKGGSIAGIIAALNHLIELAVPEDREEGGTYIIPGHGRLCDRSDVTEYRDMVTIIRDRIQDLIKQGNTLDQIQMSNPTKDYDPLYPSAPERKIFVEAVYRSLTQPGSFPPQRP